MTPAARVQGAIEILDLVIDAARNNGPPADRILADWFRTRRFAGSKDRRAVRELAYSAIRACGEVPLTGRTAMLRLAADDAALAGLFDGSNYGPAPIGADESPALAGIAPGWLAERLTASGVDDDEAGALLDRAPLDIRINTIKASRETLELPVEAEPAPAPHALRLPAGTRVETWDAFSAGQIEVQDAGSQLACAALDVQPGETVVDLCAGAGGKTLALAAAMENRGNLIASDTDRGRLSKLGPRAARAGARVAETVLLNPGHELEALANFAGKADAVLVDAPCSGTGTWRRNPESRWRLTPSQLERYKTTQGRLLDIAAKLVRPGGRIGYVVCSLLDEEGADRIDAFLADGIDWEAQVPALGAGENRGRGMRLNPFRDGTDGFFIARLVRVC